MVMTSRFGRCSVPQDIRPRDAQSQARADWVELSSAAMVSPSRQLPSRERGVARVAVALEHLAKTCARRRLRVGLVDRARLQHSSETPGRARTNVRHVEVSHAHAGEHELGGTELAAPCRQLAQSAEAERPRSGGQIVLLLDTL